MTTQDYEAAMQGIIKDMVKSFAQYRRISKEQNTIPSEHQYFMQQYLTKQYDLIQHINQENLDGIYMDHNNRYSGYIALNNNVCRCDMDV